MVCSTPPNNPILPTVFVDTGLPLHVHAAGKKNKKTRPTASTSFAQIEPANVWARALHSFTRLYSALQLLPLDSSPADETAARIK